MQEKLALLSKWKMHCFYARHPRIARYLPPAAALTSRTLQRHLDAYGTVYVKATRQHTGRGVIKAWRADSGYRYVFVKGKEQPAATAGDLYRQILKAIPRQTFIVQKAIDLATLNGRPFDIRVMMMRDGERKWQYAGMLAKVAGKSSVVSNVQRGGGYALTLEEALRRSLHYGTERIAGIKAELLQLSRTIMKYSDKHPFFSFQCGIDLAVDKQGRIWIIEVNLHNPSHSLFNRLSDKTFYRRIGKLYRSYRSKNTRLI